MEQDRSEGSLAGMIEGLILRSLEGISDPVRIGITGGGKALFAGFEAALIETDVVSTAAP
ncbi:MAG: hypothetical protein CME06_14395 [Gemmatimonadetes bacterium]|nr:hypothetical protein [Gemmatimonadota bacterium]